MLAKTISIWKCLGEIETIYSLIRSLVAMELAMSDRYLHAHGFRLGQGPLPITSLVQGFPTFK